MTNALATIIAWGSPITANLHSVSWTGKLEFALILGLPIVLFLLIPLGLLIHCVINPRLSPITKVGWLFFILVTGPIAAYTYIAVVSGKSWVKVFSVLIIVLSGLIVLVSIGKSYAKIRAFGSLTTQNMPAQMRLPIPATNPSEIVDLGQKADAYGHLMRLNQWTIILSSFQKDQPLLYKPNPTNRAALGRIAPAVAAAYQYTAQPKKAAYYYALAAKLIVEQSNNQYGDYDRYLRLAMSLDPASLFVQKVNNTIRQSAQKRVPAALPTAK